MLELSSLSLTAIAGPIADPPPGEGREAQKLADSFAAMLGAQLGAPADPAQGLTEADGKDLPLPGTALPDVAGPEGESAVASLPEAAVQEAAPVVATLFAALPAPSAAEPAPVLPASPGFAPRKQAIVDARGTPELTKLAPIAEQAGPRPLNLAILPPETAASRPAAQPAAGSSSQVNAAGPARDPEQGATAPERKLPELPANASPRAVAVQVALAAGLSPAKMSQGQDARAAVVVPVEPSPRGEPAAPATAAVPLRQVALPPAGGSDAPSGQDSGKAKDSPIATVRQLLAPAVAPEPQLPQPQVPAPAAATGEAAASAAAAPALPRTDFGAIVDRLVEAREAAGAQPVRIALDHAQFGRISLDFRAADAGFSVAMTSPDPDFARAANAALAAAMPAEQPAPQGDSGQARRDTAQSGSSDNSSQRGPAPERRDENQRQRHAAPHDQPEPGRPRRDGIFA